MAPKLVVLRVLAVKRFGQRAPPRWKRPLSVSKRLGVFSGESGPDVVIVYTSFRYGRIELSKFVTKLLFIAWGVAVIAASFVVHLLFIAEFGLVEMAAARYSAFLQNLLVSGLFIAMFVARRGARGQSLTTAIAKWIGTLAPTILMGAIHGSPFVLVIGSRKTDRLSDTTTKVATRRQNLSQN